MQVKRGRVAWRLSQIAALLAILLLIVTGDPGRVAVETRVKPPVVTAPAIVGSIAGALVAPRTELTKLLPPASGALWGAWVAPTSGQTDAQAVAALETLAGRQLDVVHQYEAFDDTWPTSTQTTWAAGGRTLFANVSARQKSGSVLTWTAVANGSQDSTIDALAGRLKSFGNELFISFDEEPENRYHANPATYTLASFVAAYKHLHDRLAADGVTNLTWVWNVSGYSGDESIYPSLYPGDSYVDWVAWDPYNWYNCSVNTTNTWQSFDTIVQPFYDWVSGGKLSSGSATKPLMLAEYGTVEHGTSPTKGQWFTDEVSSLPNRPNLKAVVYYDENKDCNWPITTSQASITGFATAGLNCYVYTGGPCNLLPTVSSVLPNLGPATGGTSVKITGSNLAGATAVRFGSAAASTFTVDSGTQITATSPPGAGTVDVKVTIPAGTSASTTPDRFTYTVKCISAALTSDKPSPQPAATPLTLTASSSGCTSPLYAFWIQYPNGIWYLKRSFGAATFAWSTAGLAPGTYTVHVWANQSGDSTAAFEAVGSYTMALTGCTSASLSPATVAQSAGTVVDLTASSAGCPNPVYEFWVGYPSGAWVMKQAFSTTATFSWNTAGLASGKYSVHVWANQQGAATATWEGNGAASVALSGCTAASLLPANPSSPAGTPVSLTATATGCANPLYEFWVGYPNGTWVMKQAFSSNATFNWSSAGLAPGTYLIHVWANNSGDSTVTWEANGSDTVTLTGCTSAALKANLASPQGAGSSINFTATSSGCPNPVYEFWLQDTVGKWHLMRGFGGATWTWNTAGWGKGVYHLHVWANQQGAYTGSLEVVGSATFTLN